MDRSSVGGTDAARVGVYRHALVRRIIDLLGLTAHVGGWSPLTLAVAGVIMSLDQKPLVLWLIRVGTVFLLTDVTDPRDLSRSAAGTLYRRRWGL